MAQSLEKLFGSRTRAKLLGWFFTHVDETFSVRQLANIVNEDPSNLSRELTKLENLGILVSSRDRNLKRFEVNNECAFIPELKGIVQKTSGIIGKLKEALATVKGIELAILYGSFAKGSENAGSDVDILIVGDPELSELDNTFSVIEKTFGRTINYSLYGRKEYLAKKAARDGFLVEVLNGSKVWIIGKNDGLDPA